MRLNQLLFCVVSILFILLQQNMCSFVFTGSRHFRLVPELIVLEKLDKVGPGRSSLCDAAGQKIRAKRCQMSVYEVDVCVDGLFDCFRGCCLLMLNCTMI